MLLWIIAAVVIAISCIVGYYQGAVRGAFSTLGLIVAAFLALPLSVVTTPLLRLCKMQHPVLLAIFAPIVAYLIVLIAFKVGGFFVHRKLATFYKYHDSDTRRMLFDRMNERVGVCLGVVNGTIYVMLISIVGYSLGYATTQFATTSDAPIAYRVVNAIARAVESSGMTKAIAPYNPAPPTYYKSSDILAEVYHTPLLQKRLSTYPPFLMLAERPEFQEIGKDNEFQEFWARQPSLTTFTSHPRIKPLIENVDLYNEIVGLTKEDLDDLKEYLATGVSPKYQDELILGRWRFDANATLIRARLLNPNMPRQQRLLLRQSLEAKMKDAVLTAALQQKIKLKTSSSEEEGTWERTATGKYILTTGQGKVEATVEGRKMHYLLNGVPMVFKKT